MNKKRCSNCKCFRYEQDFIGKNGGEVKRCLKCREKDDRQKRKPEVIERRNLRHRDKKYYKVYRQNKRELDEEEYLKHNAESAKHWRENNKETVKAWRTNNLNYRLKGIKCQAKKKNLIWDETMTKEVCENLMRNNCIYCGFISDKTVNGIDRMDNSIGYSLSNCVSCCKNCNFIKRCLDPITFIKRCSHITFKNTGVLGQEFNETWKSCSSYVSYSDYKNRASKRNLIFNLSEEEFNTLVNNKCYYCKINQLKVGIDRLDSSIGYCLSNCVPCCKECNYMKGAIPYKEFLKQCKSICVYNKNKNFSKFINIPTNLHSIKSR